MLVRMRDQGNSNSPNTEQHFYCFTVLFSASLKKHSRSLCVVIYKLLGFNAHFGIAVVT